MKRTRLIAEYALVILVVLILGSLSGWYFFLRGQTQSTQSQDAARGYEAPGQSSSAPGSGASGNPQSGGSVSGASSPGFFARVYGAVFGGGAKAPPPASSASFGSVSSLSSAGGAGPSANFGGSSGEEAARAAVPQLWQVEKTPVAGFAFVNDGSGARVRFVERPTGYVVDADPVTGLAARRTNTLMPKVYEALFGGAGEVILRSLDSNDAITTFVGTFATSTGANATSTGMLTGASLPIGIMQVAPDPKSGNLFYLGAYGNGSAGVKTGAGGSKPKQVFSSGILHWKARWLSDGRIILSERAGDGIVGHAYVLGGDGGLAPLVPPLPGLTLAPKSGSGAALWATSAGGTIALFPRVSASSTSVRLPVATLADKCAWAPVGFIAYCGVPETVPVGDFLDDWYRGAAHSQDAIWNIDASAGSAAVFYTPPAGTSLDVKDPAIDPSGSYLAFVNASDDTLWILRLHQ